MFLGNIQWHKTLFHELAITVVPHGTFLFSKAIGCPSYMRILLIAKSLTLMWTLNGFVKSKNFNIRAKEGFSFKSSNAFYCSFFHSKVVSPFTKTFL
jgi:hypothetical protein